MFSRHLRENILVVFSGKLGPHDASGWVAGLGLPQLGTHRGVLPPGSRSETRRWVLTRAFRRGPLSVSSDPEPRVRSRSSCSGAEWRLNGEHQASSIKHEGGMVPPAPPRGGAMNASCPF